jgi:hypothetical protein
LLRAAVLLTLARAGTPRLAAQERAPEMTLRLALPDWLGACLTPVNLRTSLDAALARARSEGLHAVDLQVELRASEPGEPGSALLELRAWHGPRYLGSRMLPIRKSQCGSAPALVSRTLVMLARNPAADGGEDRPPPSAAKPEPAMRSSPADDLQRIAEPPAPAFWVSPLAQPARPRFKLGAGLAALLGVLPRPATTLRLEAETKPEFFSLRLRGSWFWQQTRASAPGSSVRFDGYELALHACLEWLLDAWPLVHARVCLGPGASSLRAAARGWPLDKALSVTLGSQLEAALPLSGSTWLRAGMGLGVALLRPRFVLRPTDRQDAITLPSPDLLQAELGIGLVQVL